MGLCAGGLTGGELEDEDYVIDWIVVPHEVE